MGLAQLSQLRCTSWHAEKDLLDGSRYSWLKGFSLAFILVASYDHHQEHLEKMRIWVENQQK